MHFTIIVCNWFGFRGGENEHSLHEDIQEHYLDVVIKPQIDIFINTRKVIIGQVIRGQEVEVILY